MSDLKRFQQLVDDIWEMVFGTERNSQTKEYTAVKPKRARTRKGKYKADDKSTPDINEAWVGGKSPKRKKNGKR